MAFRINSSHKYTQQYPSGKESGTTNDLLSAEDYLLFGTLEDKPSGGKGAQAAPKARKGGSYIRAVNSAQADYF